MDPDYIIENKIYIVITPFFPSSTSFRGPYIYDQVRALEKKGKYNIIVLKPKSFFSKEKDYEYEGINVYLFNVLALPSNLFPGLFNPISFIFLKQKIKKFAINFDDIEIVHAHATENGYYANALKNFNKNIKTVLQHHGLDVLQLKLGRFSRFKWHKYLVKRNSVQICNRIDLHIGVSSGVMSSFKPYNEIKIKDSYVLYNGVDLNKFYLDKTIKNKNNFTIGCIANFIPLKDQLTLIKAVHILINQGMSDILVNFVGSGPTLKDCRKYIDKNKLNEYFTFCKEINHTELRMFYNTLDLFVMPSYYEAFGCVYVEANVCEVPFMAVKGQGIEEILAGDKNQWLIDKSDSKQLAVLIQNFRKNKPKQILNISLNIDELITDFISKVELI